jgi:spore photoproduct lyase
MKTADDIKTVLFDENEKDNEIVRKFLKIKSAESAGYKTEEELGELISSLKKQYKSKEVLILKPFKGRFFQVCPGSNSVTCCNYRLINTCFNCLYDCTYCFLNFYLNSFGITQFTNTGDMYSELDNFLAAAGSGNVYRIGSGEFTDSLMMDQITGIGETIIAKCAPHKNIMIELKTKSSNIDHLLGIKDKGNAVIAWSLNTKRNIAKYEPGTASLSRRIESARKACEAGYFLAFHFDPIIIYNGWKEDYKLLIYELFSSIDPDRVVWISMGGFRYTPAFKDVLREKFPDEELTLEEMFPGVDGKYRYLKKIRLDIYRTIKSYINAYTNKPFIYLCMENTDVWDVIFDRHYDTDDKLEEDFGRYLMMTFLS